MNNVLARIIDETAPVINKKITDGTIKDIFKTIPVYLDTIIKSSIKSLSHKTDLQYLGYRKLSPKEEFERQFLNKSNAVIYDLASTDIYMIELKFMYNGKPFNRYLYLPYARRGNLMEISNTMYHVTPVLSDTVISPSHKEVFVRLLKDKLTFKSVIKNFIKDGNVTPSQVIHSKILRINEAQVTDNIGKPVVATSLYLTAKYGLRQAMKLYSGSDDVLITKGVVTDAQKENYHVYESTGLKPKGHKEYVYTPHNIKILVPKHLANISFLDNFIFGLLYTMDILPEHSDDLIEIFNSGNVDDEMMYWKVILGRVTYKNSFSVERMTTDIIEHFDALEGYIDGLIKEKLSDSGVKVENFFDLLTNILTNYNMWLINSKEYNSDINNRYIDILYYVMYEIIIGFNKVILGINKRTSKKTATSKASNTSYKSLEINELTNIFVEELSPKKIFGLVKGTGNLSIMLADSTVDMMYIKTTVGLEDQSRGAGVKKGRGGIPESNKTIKADDLLFGSMLFLGKTTQSPRLKQNIYMDYDVRTGKIHTPVPLQKPLSKIDMMLTGRLDNIIIPESIVLNSDDD